MDKQDALFWQLHGYLTALYKTPKEWAEVGHWENISDYLDRIQALAAHVNAL